MDWNLAPPIIEGVPMIAFGRRNREIPEMEAILEVWLGCGEDTVIETFSVTIQADARPVYVIVGIDMGEDGTLMGVLQRRNQLKRARKERDKMNGKESGQDKAEYALLLGFIAAVAVVVIGLIGEGLVSYLDVIGKAIGAALGVGA